MKQEGGRVVKGHVSEANSEELGVFSFLLVQGLIFFLHGSRIAELLEQQAGLEDRMREDRDALMDKLHQQTTETTSFRMENERLKVSDSKLRCCAKKQKLQ